jgi:hypothetical protein
LVLWTNGNIKMNITCVPYGSKYLLRKYVGYDLGHRPFSGMVMAPLSTVNLASDFWSPINAIPLVFTPSEPLLFIPKMGKFPTKPGVSNIRGRNYRIITTCHVPYFDNGASNRGAHTTEPYPICGL